MIQKAKQILIFFLIYLFISNLGVLNSTQANFDSQSKTATRNFPIITVLTSPNSVKTAQINFKTQNAGQDIKVCNSSFNISGKGLVQSQNNINLNQPAECFRLIGILEASPVASLEVKTIQTEQIIVVARQNYFISKINYQTPVAQSNAMPFAIPQMLFGSLIIFAVLALQKKLKIRIACLLKKSLTIHQLMVLRC